MSYHVFNGRRVYLSEDGRFVRRISGMDTQTKMPVIAQHGECLVFKRNGFTGWMCVGEVCYYPPEYYLVRVVDNVIQEVLQEAEVDRQSWRSVRDQMVAMAQSM